MKPLDIDSTRKGVIIFEDVNLPDSVDVTKILECVMNTESATNLSEAGIIVAGGRPICSEQGMSVLKEFAEAVGAEVACTRVVVEEGFMPTDRQVGQTGQTVRPEIYFACGISGAVQHRAGMDGSRYIVAINKDPDASIFEIADVAVVADIYQILPVLTRTIKDYKGLSRTC
jgi:electron transfer flavoprotein alpha subunit